MRSDGEESRVAIGRAALATFCERGYRTSTLEEIGARVGVTRGTVLHHFNSKAALLGAVVGPYLNALSGLLDSIDVDEPPTAAQQRRLLTELADTFLLHRLALRLLATDVTARVQLGLPDQFAAPGPGLVALFLGPRAGQLGQVRVAAALGAMVAPMAAAGLDLHTARSRNELIGAALAVLDRPGPARGPGTTKVDSHVPARAAAQ